MGWFGLGVISLFLIAVLLLCTRWCDTVFISQVLFCVRLSFFVARGADSGEASQLEGQVWSKRALAAHRRGRPPKPLDGHRRNPVMRRKRAFNAKRSPRHIEQAPSTYTQPRRHAFPTAHDSSR